MNWLRKILHKARELFAPDVHEKVVKRDQRAAVIDYVLEENKRKRFPL